MPWPPLPRESAFHLDPSNPRPDQNCPLALPASCLCICAKPILRLLLFSSNRRLTSTSSSLSFVPYFHLALRWLIRPIDQVLLSISRDRFSFSFFPLLPPYSLLFLTLLLLSSLSCYRPFFLLSHPSTDDRFTKPPSYLATGERNPRANSGLGMK